MNDGTRRDALELLRRARDVELPNRGWHQGALEGPDGQVCAKGAINAAFNALWGCNTKILNLDAYFAAERALQRAVGGVIPVWNDEKCETVADVFDGFDLAIKSLEDAS